MTEKASPKSKVRIPMAEQGPKTRARNFQEVPLGYTPGEAIEEASRCLHCKRPLCQEGCPVGVDIRSFVALIKEGKFLEASASIKETNALPAVCGRVCPQEIQCEGKCIAGKTGDAIAIGNLEKFCADYESSHSEPKVPEIPGPSGYKVAIVGSGPGGLTCAAELAMAGHSVTLYEALHVAGGVLSYGIPEFRLPKAIVKREVDYIEALGVEIVVNSVIGNLFTLDELLTDKGFNACFVATGAGLPMFLDIPGENLNGVYSANEFLTRANLMKAYRFPEYDTPIKRGRNVGVIGGGNVAMDSARVALRLGAQNVYLIYRRSEAEMPARKAEVHHAKEEGVQFKTLSNPVEYLDDGQGNVRGVRCQRMELGEPDDSGRRRPIPIKDSEFELEIDVAIPALGSRANPLLLSTQPDMGLNKWGYIVADPETGMTTKEGVFAGGDIVTGSATVILAMGAGKKAAHAIDDYLKWKHWDTRGMI